MRVRLFAVCVCAALAATVLPHPATAFTLADSDRVSGGVANLSDTDDRITTRHDGNGGSTTRLDNGNSSFTWGVTRSPSSGLSSGFSNRFAPLGAYPTQTRPFGEGR